MKWFVMLVCVLFYSIGCNDSKKVEILPDYDEIYLPVSKVETPVEILGDTDKQLEQILLFITETSRTNTNGYYFFESLMFINENGKLEKIKFKKSIPSNFNKNGEINYEIEKLFEKLTKYLALQEFSPAVNNGKRVKSQFEWEGSFRVDSIGMADVYLGSLAMSALKKKYKINPKDYDEIAEEMPSPIGGINAIAKNVIYPESAKQAGIEGRVFIKAFIDEEGNVVWTEILRGIGAGCDQAAITAVVNTKFNPGTKDGKPVKVQISIPIMFKLN